jgi:hypothetical protein
MLDAITAFLVRIAPSLMEWALVLFPLTLYLIWLGFGVGRRKRPLILAGSTDTVLLILALCGFFLIGPPTWVLNRYAVVGWKSYLIGYGVYLVVIGFLAWAWVQTRRRSIVIYCIDPEVFPQLMRQALEELGEPYQITPGRIALAGTKLVLDLDASQLFCVTVRWFGDAATWAALETHLRPLVEQQETKNNPSGALLPLWAGLALMFCSLSTVIFLWYLAFMST